MKPTSGIYIVSYAAGLHILWGVALLCTKFDQWATPISPYFGIFGGHYSIAFWLLGISFVALAGKIWKARSVYLLMCLIPQQVLLMLSAWASGFAIYNQQYADGVPRPFVFIFCDQLPNILAMLAHTGYVVEVAAETLRKRLVKTNAS